MNNQKHQKQAYTKPERPQVHHFTEEIQLQLSKAMLTAPSNVPVGNIIQLSLAQRILFAFCNTSSFIRTNQNSLAFGPWQ